MTKEKVRKEEDEHLHPDASAQWACRGRRAIDDPQEYAWDAVAAGPRMLQLGRECNVKRHRPSSLPVPNGMPLNSAATASGFEIVYSGL